MNPRKGTPVTVRMCRAISEIRRYSRILGRSRPLTREGGVESVRLLEYRRRQESERLGRAEAVLRAARDFAANPAVQKIHAYVPAIEIPPPHGCRGRMILDLSGGSLSFKGGFGDGPSPAIPLPSAEELCFIMRLTWGLDNLEMEFCSERLWKLIGKALDARAARMKRTLERRRRRAVRKSGKVVMGGIIAPRGRVVVLE